MQLFIFRGKLATSHEVTQSLMFIILSPLFFFKGNKPSPLKKKPEKNLPTSFANFFKKAPISTPPEVTKTSKTIDSKKGRKRKRDPDEGDGEKTPKKKKDPKDLNKFNSLVPSASNQATVSNQGLNLASTSLILFEDVRFDSMPLLVREVVYENFINLI